MKKWQEYVESNRNKIQIFLKEGSLMEYYE